MFMPIKSVNLSVRMLKSTDIHDVIGELNQIIDVYFTHICNSIYVKNESKIHLYLCCIYTNTYSNDDVAHRTL